MPAATRRALLPASQEAVMAVLTDFGAYPRIFPILEAVEVSRASAREWEVRFTLFYLRRLRYSLLIQRPEPGRLLWSLIEGDLKAAEGSWQVEPKPDGQVEVELRLDVQTTMRLPGPFLRSLEEVELPRVLMGLRAELERRATPAAPASRGAVPASHGGEALAARRPRRGGPAAPQRCRRLPAAGRASCRWWRRGSRRRP